MPWWLWILLGLGLLTFELALPSGFFAFFFGFAAILVGALAGLGLAGPAYAQWLLFPAFAVFMVALLRRPLSARLNLKGSSRAVDSLLGEGGIVLEEVPVGGVGKVEVRGSSWNARGLEAIARGKRCRVDWVDGLTLWVRPD